MKAADLFTIEELRAHIEFCGDDRDEMLCLYAQSALDYCLWYCDNANFKNIADVPSQVKMATLLVFADLFEHRASQEEIALYKNEAVRAMLWSCRNWSNKEAE